MIVAVKIDDLAELGCLPFLSAEETRRLVEDRAEPFDADATRYMLDFTPASQERAAEMAETIRENTLPGRVSLYARYQVTEHDFRTDHDLVSVVMCFASHRDLIEIMLRHMDDVRIVREPVQLPATRKVTCEPLKMPPNPVVRRLKSEPLKLPSNLDQFVRRLPKS